jgi:hypothetical protein
LVPRRSYPARIARTLALAHELQRRIDGGEFANQAEVARALGFSRERISKMLGLLFLAPDIQEQILFLECLPGEQPLNEANLHRTVLRAAECGEQREVWGGWGRPPTETDRASSKGRRW